MERLHTSLKALMQEKESKLNNSSINSRAVVERTGALKQRIEELESQLVQYQQVCLSRHNNNFNFRQTNVFLGKNINCAEQKL